MRAGEKGNVILLPRTIDYYQMRLTRLLETDRFAEAEPRIRFVAARAGQAGASRSAAGLRFAARLPDVPQLRGSGWPEEAARSPVLLGACLGLLGAAGWQPEGGMPDDRGPRGAHAAGTGPKQDQYA